MSSSYSSPSSVWPIGVISTYVLTIVFLAISGRTLFLTQSILFPFFFTVAVLSRQFKIFLHDWVLYLAVLILYESLRGFIFSIIHHFNFPIYVNYVLQWEKVLLNGYIAPYAAQYWLSQLKFSAHFYQFFSVFYGSHFAIFLLLGLIIWFNRRQYFYAYKFSFILMTSIGLLFFLLFPTVPPWMASQYTQAPPIIFYVAKVYTMTMPKLFHVFDMDPVAAMPSLHAAFSLLCSLIAFHLYRWKAWPVLIYTILLNMSCIILGAHYLVDLLAGFLLASIIFFYPYSFVCKKSQNQNLFPLSQDRINMSLKIKISFSILILIMSALLKMLSDTWM